MQTNYIKNIAIVGAGAMGAAYASMLADAEVFSPFFLADGERYRRLVDKPLRVNGKPYAIPVMRPEDVKKPVDLVFVALKHHHLADALPAIEAGPETIILSVMNGYSSRPTGWSFIQIDRKVSFLKKPL